MRCASTRCSGACQFSPNANATRAVMCVSLTMVTLMMYFLRRTPARLPPLMPGLLGLSRVTFETSAGHAFLLELGTPGICLGVGRVTDAIFGIDPQGGLCVAVVSGELD
jgi:hypothetical protein